MSVTALVEFDAVHKSSLEGSLHSMGKTFRRFRAL
jgi:hypothetical protein